VPKKSEEARGKTMRSEAGDAKGRRAYVMTRRCGPREEKRRSREQLVRTVTSVKAGAVRRTSSVERVRREAPPVLKPVAAARTGERDRHGDRTNDGRQGKRTGWFTGLRSIAGLMRQAAGSRRSADTGQTRGPA